jgi:hypothetical protein
MKYYFTEKFLRSEAALNYFGDAEIWIKKGYIEGKKDYEVKSIPAYVITDINGKTMYVSKNIIMKETSSISGNILQIE